VTIPLPLGEGQRGRRPSGVRSALLIKFSTNFCDAHPGKGVWYFWFLTLETSFCATQVRVRPKAERHFAFLVRIVRAYKFGGSSPSRVPTEKNQLPAKPRIVN
jgi:hypothetical protein